MPGNKDFPTDFSSITATKLLGDNGTNNGNQDLASGVSAFLATPSSSNLAAAMTDETGTGALVFANAPTLIAPVLGTPASGNASNLTSLTASELTGTLPDATFPATLPAVDGSQLTNLPGTAPAILTYSAASQVGAMTPATPLMGTELLYLDQGGGDAQLSLANLFGGSFPPSFGFALLNSADAAAAGVTLTLQDAAYHNSSDFAAVASNLTDLSDYAAGNNQGRAALYVDKVTSISDIDYTIVASDKFVQYTAVSAQRFVQLIGGSNNGQEIIIFDSSGGASALTPITVLAIGAITGIGANGTPVVAVSSYDIANPYGYVRLCFSGGSHFIVGAA